MGGGKLKKIIKIVQSLNGVDPSTCSAILDGHKSQFKNLQPVLQNFLSVDVACWCRHTHTHTCTQ